MGLACWVDDVSEREVRLCYRSVRGENMGKCCQQQVGCTVLRTALVDWIRECQYRYHNDSHDGRVLLIIKAGP